MGLEINSTGIQQLTPAEKLRTAERGWKITVLEYKSYPLLEFRNRKLLNTMLQYTEHAKLFPLPQFQLLVQRSSQNHYIGSVLPVMYSLHYINERKNLDTLTSESDQLLISPYNITPESSIKVTRIKDMTNNL